MPPILDKYASRQAVYAIQTESDVVDDPEQEPSTSVKSATNRFATGAHLASMRNILVEKDAQLI